MLCRGVPSYIGLMWDSLSLAREIFLIWKGNTISDPSLPMSSKQMGVSETLYQLGAFLILYKHNIFGITERFPFWEHCALAEQVL